MLRDCSFPQRVQDSDRNNLRFYQQALENPAQTTRPKVHFYVNPNKPLSFLIGSSRYLVPRPSNEDVRISKTMHPDLLGKRNI